MTALPRVLVVDDEPEVLEAIRDVLRRQAEVFATTDPEEAYRIIKTTSLALIVSDQRMPTASGVEILSFAARIQPDCVRVLITGWSDIDAVVSGVNEGRIDGYVVKPWSSERMLALVADAAGRAQRREEKSRLLGALADATGGPLPGKPDENATLAAAVDRVGAALRSLDEIGDLLPICLQCGRVRTGTAQWEDVIAVLHRVPTLLTHGYCPDCAVDVRAAFKGAVTSGRKTE